MIEPGSEYGTERVQCMCATSPIERFKVALLIVSLETLVYCDVFHDSACRFLNRGVLRPPEPGKLPVLQHMKEGISGLVCHVTKW